MNTNQKSVGEIVKQSIHSYSKGSREWAVLKLVTAFRHTTASKETMELILAKQVDYILAEALAQRERAVREDAVDTVLHNIKTEIGWGNIGFTHEKNMKVAVYIDDIERICEEALSTNQPKV
jgi:hypothetical protein